MTDHALALLTGGWAARAVTAAVRLGVIEVLAERPADGAGVAARLGLDEPAVARLLRLLHGLDLVEALPDGAGYRLSEAGAPLARDHPRSLRLLADLYEEDYFEAAWKELESGIRHGEAPFVRAHGRPVFEYLATAPEHAGRYAAAMAAGSRFGDRLADAAELSAMRCVVDVGGGDGSVLAALLQTGPDARGVLLDRPDVTEHAATTLAAAGVADRVRIVGGDFFRDMPSGGDVYLLSRVLHNWDDAQCVALLSAVRRAAAPGARVLVVERMIRTEPSGRPVSPVVLLYDLHMFVMTRGRERAESEYAALLGAAGLVARPAAGLPLGFSVVPALVPP